MPDELPLVDDLADVLSRVVVGWEDRLGVDLAQYPDVQRVMARYRNERVARKSVIANDEQEGKGGHSLMPDEPRKWTDKDGRRWECDAYDHGPFCRLCRLMPDEPTTTVADLRYVMAWLDKETLAEFKAGVNGARLFALVTNDEGGITLQDAVRSFTGGNS